DQPGTRHPAGADGSARLGRTRHHRAGGVGGRPAGAAGDGLPPAAQRGHPPAGRVPDLPGRHQPAARRPERHRRRLAGGAAAVRPGRPVGAGAVDPGARPVAARRPRGLRAGGGLVRPARPRVDLLRPAGPRGAEPHLAARRCRADAGAQLHRVHPRGQRAVERPADRGRRGPGRQLRDRGPLRRPAQLPRLRRHRPPGRVAGGAPGPAGPGRRGGAPAGGL
ncbi:MAG: hypothetical protein AVDCRST_MAG48-1260, partial [uncultured Friedmanniella sp.]